MPLKMIRNDITKMQVDAIVNAANKSLSNSGGVNGAIHRAAGPELGKECETLHGCRTGEAKITKGYQLPAKYVIHTVGPVWKLGRAQEEEQLYSCYRNSLELAYQHQCRSIAFPLISSGVFGYPKDKALQVAVRAISDFLLQYDMMVYLVVFGRSALKVSEKLFSDVAEYIDDHYVELHEDSRRKQNFRKNQLADFSNAASSASPCRPMPDRNSYESSESISYASMQPLSSLDELLNQVDESFSQMVLRKIDEAGMKDSECYKRANIGACESFSVNSLL